MSDTLLKVDDLRTYFHVEGRVTKAVDGVSFELGRGETLGVVGESGSGKSVTALSAMGLLPKEGAKIHTGSISMLGKDLVKLPGEELRKIRGADIAMIFQEPMTSLNPVLTVGEQVMESILIHEDTTREEARKRTIALFREVEIPDPENRVDTYPHEMSGGQKQRVMIAMALACNPKLLIADEPTTALDVTIQKGILDLMRKLRDERGMSILFITHDLGVIAEIADQVAVMFRGHLVEFGDVLQVFENPQHAYTRSLLACRPKLDTRYRRLPTTNTFLDWDLDAENRLSIVEKQVSDADLQALETAGRDKMPVVEGDPLVEIENLTVEFPLRHDPTQRFRAVDQVSLKVWPGQTLGLVGESGCGKTTLGRALLRLIEDGHGGVYVGGDMVFDKQNIKHLTGPRLKQYRREAQIIFQDPYSSLNPRMTVGSMIMEPMVIHGLHGGPRERLARAASLLVEVGLAAEHVNRYPHEFSGGQRQRISIARALAVEPRFIVCDESVSALDVSVQAQVLNLLLDLQESHGLTYIFISHDLSVVKFMSDRMAVMESGRIVEEGPSEEIYRDPKEAYTRRLIDAIPRDDLDLIRERVAARAAIRSQRDA